VASDRRAESASADLPEPKKGAGVPESVRQPAAVKLKLDKPPKQAEAANQPEKSGGSGVRLPHVNVPKLPHVKLPHVKLPRRREPTVGRRRVDRPPRVFRLDNPASSSEVVAPLTAGQVGLDVTAARVPEPMTPGPGEATKASTDGEPKAVEPVAGASPPPAVKTPPAKAETGPIDGPSSTKAPIGTLTKAWRGPRPGRHWRDRKSANGRPVAPTRPTSAKAGSGSTSRRPALPLVGRRSSVKVAGGTSDTKVSRRKLLTGKSKAGSSSSKKKKRQKQRTPATALERRSRIPVAVAGLFALAVLATSFPIAGLVSQHHQLSAAATQLEQVQRDNRALAEQQHALNSNEAVNQLARGDYQMVSPGQTLYDVLPPDSKTGTTTPGAATSGDPGDQPLVAPADAPDLSPQPGLPQPIPSTAGSSDGAGATKAGSVSSGSGVPSTPSTFWGRVTETLEFWR
jgi:cell division protein FtsB